MQFLIITKKFKKVDIDLILKICLSLSSPVFNKQLLHNITIICGHLKVKQNDICHFEGQRRYIIIHVHVIKLLMTGQL